MSEKDAEFREELHNHIESLVIFNFYRTGIWEHSRKSNAFAKELIFANAYIGDYVGQSLLDRYFDEEMSRVIKEQFHDNHIASHYYSFSDSECYTQTEQLMVERLKEYNKDRTDEELEAIARKAERREYMVNMSQFTRSVDDSFPEAAEEEKQRIRELYETAAKKICAQRLNANGYTREAVRAELRIMYEARLNRMDYAETEKFMNSFFDKVYDLAEQDVSKRYPTIPTPPSSEK